MEDGAEQAGEGQQAARRRQSTAREGHRAPGTGAAGKEKPHPKVGPEASFLLLSSYSTKERFLLPVAASD